ncbi:MAG: hypothetical protein KDA44_01935 [Planctomycetales bacterium]|nr:hypothetical protein [Planctomycetales bacterium]
MARWSTALGAALVALCWQGVVCAGQFNNVVSLGDSLFDDILGARSPVAAEHVANRLGVPWTNLARSGATTDALLEQGQHTTAAANFGAGDLALVWIGGNDFFYQASLPIALGLSWRPTLDDAAANLETTLSTLRAAGMEVVMFNLPDMAQVPFVGLPATNILGRRERWLQAYSDLSIEWAHTLGELGAEYGAPVVDVYGMVNQRLQDPQAFSILGHPVNLGPSFGGQFDIFADPIHPSAYVQGLIANAAIDVINATYDPLGVMPLERLSVPELAELVGLTAGDFDGDGNVGWRDLFTWEFNFGAHFEVNVSTHGAGDANDDGAINGADFLAWQRQYRASATTTSVPEPQSAILIGVALGAVGANCARRRRRAARGDETAASL